MYLASTYNCYYDTTTGDGGITTLFTYSPGTVLWVMPKELHHWATQFNASLRVVNVESLHKQALSTFTVVAFYQALPREGTLGFERLLVACKGKALWFTTSAVHRKHRAIEAHKLLMVSGSPGKVKQLQWALAPERPRGPLLWQFVRRQT
jgi:hypothetical protein